MVVGEKIRVVWDGRARSDRDQISKNKRMSTGKIVEKRRPTLGTSVGRGRIIQGD